SRGDASPEAASGDAPFVVQSSWAKTNAAKSTSRVSSTSRSSVETPGLKTVVHASTSAMSWSPRVSACSSFSCCPDDPRKIRGFIQLARRPGPLAAEAAVHHSPRPAVPAAVPRGGPDAAAGCPLHQDVVEEPALALV